VSIVAQCKTFLVLNYKFKADINRISLCNFQKVSSHLLAGVWAVTPGLFTVAFLACSVEPICEQQL